jgi:hypothetical protein
LRGGLPLEALSAISRKGQILPAPAAFIRRGVRLDHELPTLPLIERRDDARRAGRRALARSGGKKPLPQYLSIFRSGSGKSGNGDQNLKYEEQGHKPTQAHFDVHGTVRMPQSNRFDNAGIVERVETRISTANEALEAGEEFFPVDAMVKC